MAENKTLLVVGGGAAGFFCAVNAARLNPRLNVVILEKSGKLLSKVKISGGGRCNVTHACFDIAEMARRYPRGANFVKKVFHQFFTTDTVEWFKARGVALKTEADGRMFPTSDSSQTIINCLLQEAGKYQVQLRLHAEVNGIDGKEGAFYVHLKSGETLFADKVCIATGGYPKPEMYQWFQGIGHTWVPPVPSLFTFNLPQHPITSLMGVSVNNARVRLAGSKLQQQGPVLITHWGLSGPGVLKLSAWGARELAEKNWQFTVWINWLANYKEAQLLDELKKLRLSFAPKNVFQKNPFELPRRLWEFLVASSEIKIDTRWADLSSKQQASLARNLGNYACEVKGKTTFKEEFVTAGGICLSEIDPNTLMSRKMANLYFAGEIVDVDGITGGYNFQNAWSTGYVAALGITKN